MHQAPIDYYLNEEEKGERVKRRVVPAPPRITRKAAIAAIAEEVAAVAAHQKQSDQRQVAIASATIFLSEEVKQLMEMNVALQAQVAALTAHAEKTTPSSGHRPPWRPLLAAKNMQNIMPH